MGATQAPNPPLPIRERALRTRRERVLRTRRAAPPRSPGAPSFPRRREPTGDRHSCVGRNPLGRPIAIDGAQAPSPSSPRASSFPRKREPTPCLCAAPLPPLPAQASPVPRCDKCPLRLPPRLPYAVSMTRRSNPTTDGRPLTEAAPFGPISAPNAPNSALKQPQTGPAADPALGVNGAKWRQMEPLLRERAAQAQRTQAIDLTPAQGYRAPNACISPSRGDSGEPEPPSRNAQEEHRCAFTGLSPSAPQPP